MFKSACCYFLDKTNKATICIVYVTRSLVNQGLGDTINMLVSIVV